MVTSTSTGISQRTNVYAAKQMLAHAKPVMVLDKLADVKRMPQNKSSNVKFRRPIPFTESTTPLVEGVTPAATAFAYEDVEATLKQYGQVVEITDVIEDTHEDPVLQDATTQCGENIGRTMEALNYAVTRGGTNVFYANGAVRNAVNTKLTLASQRKVIRALEAQKGRKITSILGGSDNYETRPIEAAYIAVAHTDMEADIRDLPGFVPVAKYGSREPMCAEEIGSVESVRYVLSADLGAFEDAGGAAGGNFVSAGGTQADVYPVLYFAKGAFGTVALRGFGSVEPSIVPVGQKTKDDPLAQRGYVGWKTYHAALILNEAWLGRLEVAATQL